MDRFWGFLISEKGFMEQKDKPNSHSLDKLKLALGNKVSLIAEVS